MPGHIRDRHTSPGPNGRRVHNDRWGKGDRWQARWTDQTGDEHAKAFANKDAAEVFLRSLDLSAPAFEARHLLFGEYATRWRASQLQWRGQTAENADRCLNRMILPQLGHLRLAAVNRLDLQTAVTVWASSYSPRRVRLAYSMVKTIFRLAVDDQLVHASPCARVFLPRVDRSRVQPITTGQMQAIRAALPRHYRQMATLGAATGLRGLTVEQFDLDAGWLHVDRQLLKVSAGVPEFGPPKTGASDRRLQLPQAARLAIESQLAARPVMNRWGLVFVNRVGKPIDRRDANSVWHDNTQGLGLKPRSGWHDLRHYCASLMIARGLSVRAVADWLGHADVTETLQTYAHLWPDDHDRIVQAIDSELT